MPKSKGSYYPPYWGKGGEKSSDAPKSKYQSCMEKQLAAGVSKDRASIVCSVETEEESKEPVIKKKSMDESGLGES